MTKGKISVYISENNKDCDLVLQLLDKKSVPYEVKNVTKHPENMKDLQRQGIYGTPATFIGDEKNPILGFQEEKINLTLGVLDKNYLLNTNSSHDA
ncbi:glutaredoxin family protein [Oceanobacillus manasiensis]|uniref:glutaredoxin family protein n=1 Tax=Oceanobacillus manasiensis TaxID=586413 RepID=UPI0005A9C45C|nr:glutaredoxin family protein [Oceanobacillus manasiensis]